MIVGFKSFLLSTNSWHWIFWSDFSEDLNLNLSPSVTEQLWGWYDYLTTSFPFSSCVMSVHGCTCQSQRWTMGVFLNHSVINHTLLLLLKYKHLLLNQKLSNLLRLASQGAPGSLWFLALGLKEYAKVANFSHGCQGSKFRSLSLSGRHCTGWARSPPSFPLGFWSFSVRLSV